MAKRPEGPRPLALITGASGGIGEALAYAFARAGYDLALVARSEARLAEVAKASQALGAAAHVIPMDLEARGAGADLEARMAQRALLVDALVNNAGYGVTGAVLDADLAAQLGSIDLNVRVLTELSARFGVPMRTRGRGGILNVASMAAFQPGPYMAVYYATKAFVLSFTEALNRELKNTGVHATALCPGPVATGFQARAEFDASMGLTRLPMQTAEQAARAGFSGFRRRQAVVIPGGMNFIVAKSAGVAPRGVLLSIVEGMQKKRQGGSHGRY
jgi:short-subunit dehydrogenase